MLLPPELGGFELGGVEVGGVEVGGVDVLPPDPICRIPPRSNDSGTFNDRGPT